MDVSQNLKEILSAKYFWRDWYVIAYAKQADKDYIRLCGEEDTYYKKKAWKNSLDIIIFSSPKDEPSKKFSGNLNKYTPVDDLEGNRYRLTYGDSSYSTPKVTAKSYYQLLPTQARSCLYPIIIIVDNGVNVAMQVPEGRTHTHTFSSRYIQGQNKQHLKMKEEKKKDVYIFG